MEDKEIITVEYSLKQRCFHIDELENVLKYNQRNVLRHNPNDYLLLAVTDDVQEAQAFCHEFRNLIEEHGAVYMETRTELPEELPFR